MKNPICKINTDDDMSMNSQMDISVDKSLNRIDIEHFRQGGSREVIQVFPNQIDAIIKFLRESKSWIDSGYKEKLKPESYNEFERTERNKITKQL